MAIIKIIEVSITSLKFDSEDEWLDNYRKKVGGSMAKFPLYLALKGDLKPLKDWCKSRVDLEVKVRLNLLFDVYKSLIERGQIEPIKIDKTNKIITGHKRSSIMLAMGYEKIKAVRI